MSDTADKMFPYGRCECDGATCCGGRGPAAFSAVRDGRKMLMCTRCDLIEDADKVLLVKAEDDTADVFREFDALGFLCILGRLQEEAQG